MAKQNNMPPALQAWIDARRRFHLSHAQVQMARELGMNPKKLGATANHRQEPWKLPLPLYIEELYFKHFRKRRPDNVRSIEQVVEDRRRKQAERRERKGQLSGEPQPDNVGPPPAMPDCMKAIADDDGIPF
jgi:hypothetical protein